MSKITHERFDSFAEMRARAVEIARSLPSYEVECGIYSDNNGTTHRPQIIVRDGDTIWFLRWNYYASESGIDFISKRARVEAREMSERMVEEIKAEIVATVDSSTAVEIVNEYTAIKLSAPSNLAKLARILSTSNDVAAMLGKHESIAQLNVHSHGAIIADLVELTRRAHELAKAFQLEVQGR